jgi:predicted GH43/DUF377 family glycosyl hydrolase
MRWDRLGLVWKPAGESPWARSHAIAPTPLAMPGGTIRVFVTTLDDAGRGRPGYVDVASDDPTRVLGTSRRPLLEIGSAGSFDDNGVMPLSVVRVDPETLFMYYAGFELCRHVRYRIFTGLAISRDAGESFVRHSRVPILDRTDEELLFRGGSFVLAEDGVFRMWYVAGSEWTDVNGKLLPVYDLRHVQSSDGIRWPGKSVQSMKLAGADEHAFGRPWITKAAEGGYRMFYSIRRRSFGAYRLGYARSEDGARWERHDDEIGLEVSAEGFESQAIMYSAVVSSEGRTYCFYNGNNFGQDGFAVARLVPGTW